MLINIYIIYIYVNIFGCEYARTVVYFVAIDLAAKVEP
ncbi:hypothetical protein BQ6471_01309 [Vibrio gazogenes]|nr:hypothetical protein BQ6471_01309 [Vibrio gazogenes]